MNSKVLLAFCVVLTIASAVPQAGWTGWPPAGLANPWIPPWISSAPWYPQWAPCTTIGKSCLDCSTKLVCSIKGGMQITCTDPTKPHCNLGECSATPSEECAISAAPASQ